METYPVDIDPEQVVALAHNVARRRGPYERVMTFLRRTFFDYFGRK